LVYDVGSQFIAKLRPVFRLIHSGILAISAISLVQLAPLGSSIEFPLNLSVYCFAICTPLAGMQAVLLTIQLRVPEGVRTHLSYRVHVVLVALTILSFYAGTLYMCAYFSLSTSLAFGLASSMAYALLMYMLVPEQRRALYTGVFFVLIVIYSVVVLYFPYWAYDVLCAYELIGN
jgi:hypothetical protein